MTAATETRKKKGAPAGPAAATADAPGGSRSLEIERILGLSVPVSVVLAEQPMSIESILSVTVGTIVEFDVPFDAELTLFVANHPVGKGHAVKIGENFGLRLTRIDSVGERIDALSGR